MLYRCGWLSCRHVLVPSSSCCSYFFFGNVASSRGIDHQTLQKQFL
uniref:Uncharacterized protein n=1 Tax=Timema cristinae TaxID=61476 RepID=A0A7R9CML5_TIMCR|nr:unnamed protein product [Timema cristinae]